MRLRVPGCDALLREIDEAVRQDDALEFMRNHGTKLLGGIIALIAGLGGYMVWDNYREKGLEEQSEALIAALDAANQRDFKGASDKVAPLLDDGSAGARRAVRSKRNSRHSMGPFHSGTRRDSLKRILPGSLRSGVSSQALQPA